MSKAEKGSSKGKRRRRGGLRVPSDEVPRGKRPSDPASPSPEDPRLAVSVAYAFKDGAGASDTLPAGAIDRDDVRDTLRQREPSKEVADAIAQADAELDAQDEKVDEATEEPFDDRVTAPLDVPKALPPRGEGDSVDIAFDDDETSPLATPMGEAKPAGGKGGKARAPKNRAKTVALSDDELEEMMLSADGDLEARSTSRIPAVRFRTDDAGRIKTIMPRSKAVAVEEQVASGDTLLDVNEANEADEADEADEAGVVAEADELAEADDDAGTDPHAAAIVEPLAPDESGEMLADELLEEIDETGMAEPADLDDDDDKEDADELFGEDDEDDEDQKTIEIGLIDADEVDEAADASATPRDAKGEGAEPPPAPVAKKKPPPAPDAAEAKPPKPAAPAKPSTPSGPSGSGPATTPGAKKPRRSKPWFEEVFDENYLRTLPFLTPQATEKEANFVIDALSVEKGGQILDVGCGYGRHAMELAARGYHMVGIDVSLPLLLRGADEAQRRGLTINFVHGDMREMTFEDQFDGAYCLFSSFGYFDDDANRKTAKHIARALKPGARFVIEVLNRDYLVGDLPNRVWWEGDGCVVLEEVDFNYFSSRIVSTRSVAFDDGRQIEQEISLRAYSLHEMGRLLHAAGFRVVEVSGGMATRGRFFGAQSRDIIVVAERRKDGVDS